MKKILSAFLVLAALLSFTACGDERYYRDNVSVLHIGDEVLDALPEQDYTFTDGSYLADFIDMPDYVIEEYVAFSTEGNDLNEFGIFHVEEGHAEDMKKLLESYLADSLDAYRDWYNSYIPQETAKLENAAVEVYGNYVVYAIMSEDDSSTVQQTVMHEVGIYFTGLDGLLGD